jgi:glucose-1-phosphate cytidylyltransferase
MLSYLVEDKNCDFEFGPLQQIAREGELKAFRHDDFWQCMDNMRERDYLNHLIEINKAPWTVWKR